MATNNPPKPPPVSTLAQDRKRRYLNYLKGRIVYIIAIVLILSLGLTYYITEYKIGDINAGAITIGDTTIVVELAKNHPERALGLGGRDSLPQDAGMYFVFPDSDYYQFWMKDMKFPIDIIWIDKFMKIVDIKENVLPDTYPEMLTPKEKALTVLEVNAGFAKAHKVSVGDEIKFSEH